MQHTKQSQGIFRGPSGHGNMVASHAVASPHYPPIDGKTILGKVVQWNEERGFGFIYPDFIHDDMTPCSDVFFHFSAIVLSDAEKLPDENGKRKRRSFSKGRRVSFVVGDTSRGIVALNVQLIHSNQQSHKDCLNLNYKLCLRFPI